MKKRIIAAAIALLLLLPALLGMVACAARPVLNVLNWGDYIDPALITRFERENGVKVRYTTMESNEEMLVKLRASDNVFDLCFPSDYVIEKLLNEDLLAEPNRDNIPNLANIDPAFWEFTEAFDPGARHSVPYMWGTLGILYNSTMVSGEVDSWNILWDEQYRGQILMYNSARDSMAVALARLGYDINTTDRTELYAARDALMAQRPLVQAYGTDEMKGDMVKGYAALCVVYSGDALLAVSENEDLRYVVPREGSNIWFDNMIIPKTAKNQELAERFINFLCDADVAAQNAEYVGYSTPNAAALAIMGDEYSKNEIYNPPADMRDRCRGYHDLGEFNREYTAAWEAVLGQ